MCYLHKLVLSHSLCFIEVQISILVSHLSAQDFLEDAHSRVVVERDATAWRNENYFNFYVQVVIDRDGFNRSFSTLSSTLWVDHAPGVVLAAADVVNVKGVH
jgi:hypothetical protein